jgi:hypothetical protein
MSRPRTKRLKFEPKNAELRPHPKLQGEYGLFAISTVEREGVLYKEEVPVVYELSSFLEGTDRYIAAEKGGKTTFILLKHESFISLSYRLNSSKAPKQGYNVLDRNQRGPNVLIYPTYQGKTRATLTVRATRKVRCGDELLWDYDTFEQGLRSELAEGPLPATRPSAFVDTPAAIADAHSALADAPPALAKASSLTPLH